MLKIRPLLVHHLGQELVFQTISGHCEIDESGLGLNFGLIVRIGQLGVEDESKPRVEETLFVPDFDTAVRKQSSVRAENQKKQVVVGLAD